MTTHTSPPLHGCTILELGLAEAGQYAGHLLTQLGARVITIEPIGGLSSRSLPPFVHDENGRRRSIPHEYLNAGKESISVELTDGLLAALLRSFEARADLLLVGGSFEKSVPEDLKLPVVATSFYGSASGRTDIDSTPLTRFLAGGSGSIMPTSRPAVPGTLAGECFSGAGIVQTVLALLLMRARAATDAASRADHCEQAHLVNLEKMFIARISKDKAVVTRETHRYPFGGAVRCKDGFVSMLINEKHQWKGFCEAIGRPEWSVDERFATGSARFKMIEEIEAALLPWCITRTRQEVVDAMRGRSVPIGSVNEVGELPDNQILKARRFIHRRDTPYGPAATLGLPYGSDPLWHSEAVDHRPFAPVVGEQTLPVLLELGYSAEKLRFLENLNLIRCENA